MYSIFSEIVQCQRKLQNYLAVVRSGTGFIKIVEYDANDSGKKSKKPLRLLYSGSNHYDLLIE